MNGLQPPELLTLLLFIAQSITTISVAISWVVTMGKAAKKPSETRYQSIETRLSKLEQRMDDTEKNLKEDDSRVDDLEGSTNIMLKSLLAITDHLIDGNDTSKLMEARNDLDRFLVDRTKTKH